MSDTRPTPHSPSHSESSLRASPGDRLVIQRHHLGEPDRDGEILEVLGENGAPPFLVRWEDGHVAELFPGSDATVQHFQRRKRKRSSR
jgi:Domain of unknown function (DUF1918)